MRAPNGALFLYAIVHSVKIINPSQNSINNNACYRGSFEEKTKTLWKQQSIMLSRTPSDGQHLR